MTTLNPRWQSGPAGVAEVAVLQAPGDLVVVAHAAELALVDIAHRYVVGAGPHLEPKLEMTDLATKADTVEPMWIDYRTHAGGLGIPVQDHVGIFAAGLAQPDQPGKTDSGKQQDDT